MAQLHRAIKKYPAKMAMSLKGSLTFFNDSHRKSLSILDSERKTHFQAKRNFYYAFQNIS